MIFHPAVLALVAGSILVTVMILYAARQAVEILKNWDLRSGTEEQLILERKTYLVSTVLAYIFGFELLSFFLFIFTADQLHSLFVGAMCAAGSLYVNPYGYATLVVKLVTFLLAGVWLILNYVDNRADDYPLIRKKYAFFLLLVPLILLETVLQANYFFRLQPDLITSCCGTLFSSDSSVISLGGGLLPRIPIMITFYAAILLTAGLGIHVFVKSRRQYLFSAASAGTFVISVISVFSFICLYIYELPTHHCPFCMLQQEYGYIGYPLYLTLLTAGITGLAPGVLMPFKKIKSLARILPAVQRKLALTASVSFLIFAVIVTAKILLSNLVLAGY